MAIYKDTKTILANSLLQLCCTIPLEKITVTKIIENCGCSRKTFYNHFKDKYDLVNYIYESEADKILDIYNQSYDWKKTLIMIFDHFYKNKCFYLNAFKIYSQNCFYDFLYQYSRDYYINSIKKRFGNDVITEDLIFVIEYTSFGEVNMCKKWILNGMTISPEEMGNKTVHCMHPDLMKYFY